MVELSDGQLIRQIQAAPDSPALRLLFRRYRPVMVRLQRQYFIPGHDSDDWEQEALLVLHAAAQRFESQRSPNFGSFYRLNLQHRVYDLIRHSQAKKRHANMVSLEAHGSFFADTLVDQRIHLRDHLEVKETLRQLLPDLSPTERIVFNGLLSGQTPQTIGDVNQLRMSRVTAALHRGRQKLRQSLAQ